MNEGKWLITHFAILLKAGVFFVISCEVVRPLTQQLKTRKGQKGELSNEWIFYLNRFKNEWIKEILYYVYILRLLFITSKEGYFEPPRNWGSISSTFFEQLLHPQMAKAQKRQSSFQSFFGFRDLSVQMLLVECWWIDT